MPKFTIIIPAYNAADYIHIPIESLRNQTFKDFEVIIVNDGSTDSTSATTIAAASGMENVRVISKANGHWGSSINMILKKGLATGEYITIINSDDMFMPNCLELVAKQKTDIIATNIISAEHDRKKKVKVMHGGTGEKNLSRIFTPHSSPHGKFYKNKLFNNLQELVEGVPYQDGMLYNQLASRARSYYYIKKNLVVWGHNDDENTSDGEWNLDTVKYWLEMCERVIKKSLHYETTSWAIMKLKQLADHYHGQVPFRVSLNKKKAKFLYMPFGTRKIRKSYYLFKTKRFRK